MRLFCRITVWMQCILIALMLTTVHSFQTRNHGQQKVIPSLLRKHQGLVNNFPKKRTRQLSQLNFFGRNKEDDKGDVDNKDPTEQRVVDNSTAEDKDNKSFSIPFFGRMMMDDKKKEEQSNMASSKLESTSVANGQKENSAKGIPKAPEEDLNDPEVLRAKAERARLEAERMDAELTLAKIDKLEKQLTKAKSKGDSIEDLQRQLDALQSKLRGDPPPAVVVSSTPSGSEETNNIKSIKTAANSTSETVTQDMALPVTDDDVLEAARKMTTQEKFDIKTEDDVSFIPGFLLKILALCVEMEVENVDDLNKKEFFRRWEMAKNSDYSFLTNYTSPTYNEAQISNAKRQIQDGTSDLTITDEMVKSAGGNATQLALYALEYEDFLKTASENVTKMKIEDISPVFLQDFLNQTSGEGMFASLYPKCTRKEGEEPTRSQVDSLVRTVLLQAKFSSTSKPQQVPGGWMITGTHKYKNGDELIEAIDRELEKTPLIDKLTVLYAPGSYLPLNASFMGESLDSLAQMSYLDDIDEEKEPILYVTGPNIVRDSNRLGLTITSILGIATSWYLSIYPFLLNEGIGKRVDQELELLEANLQPDLTWLTDLSFPLFVTFISLQLVHEAAHRLVAAINGVKLTVPTFVPSLITGITSSVTTFKTLPKNKEAMFDISAAGPLSGIVASSIALAVGSKLTLISDPSTLPALPLDILRQSTLGGAIIDNIIQGSLYVPEGAPTAGIMISLHPVAIAGYISLVVNALSLLPIGTTDGGRLTMALFSREDKNAIGSLTLLALLYFGLFGSDLFLFYFSFVIAFQTGNEVPARNEHDPVSFSRVIVATIAYALVFLSLAPFQ